MNALNPCPEKGKKIKNFITKKIFFYHQEALLQRDMLADFAATEKNDNIFPIFSQTRQGVWNIKEIETTRPAQCFAGGTPFI